MPTIERLDLGDELSLGLYMKNRGFSRRMELVWKKVSYSNIFMLKGYIRAVSYDSPEDLNPNEAKRNHGTNFYPLSNMHQWLNGSGLDWFKPTHEYDTNSFCMPDDTGFLTLFDEQDLAALEDVTIQCSVPDGYKRLYGTTYDLTTKVFLPSLKELGIWVDDRPDEGERFDIYEGAYFEGTTLTRSPDGVAKTNYAEYGEAQQAVWCDTAQKITPCICVKGDLEVEKPAGQSVYCIKVPETNCDDLVELLSVG